MSMRWLYTLQQAWRYRFRLRDIAKLSHCQATLDLTPAYLQTHHIQVLILDFDGVLAPHGEIQPLPEIVAWLKQCLTIRPDMMVFILSNKPNPEREHYFRQMFPAFYFVKNVRKKPYPDGILSILTQTGRPATQTLMVDDRLLTGILAAQIAGVHGFYVTKCYHNWKKYPFRELFFTFLRKLEKIFYR